MSSSEDSSPLQRSLLIWKTFQTHSHTQIIDDQLSERFEKAVQALQTTRDGLDKDEVRSWLTQSIIRCGKEASRHQRRKKLEQLTEENPEIAYQLFILICREKSRLISKFFADQSDVLKDFFLGTDEAESQGKERPKTFGDNTTSRDRIGSWFRFSFDGINSAGALALEQFLFYHRDHLWNRIRWESKRPIPPPVAIQRKGVMSEMNVWKTLRNLSTAHFRSNRDYGESSDEDNDRVVREWEDFWRSENLREQVVRGDIVSCEYTFFARSLLYGFNHGHRHYRDVLLDFISEKPFSELCAIILPLATDDQILRFCDGFGTRSGDFEGKLIWDTVCGQRWSDMGRLLVYNSIITHPSIVAKNFPIADFTREVTKTPPPSTPSTRPFLSLLTSAFLIFTCVSQGCPHPAQIEAFSSNAQLSILPVYMSSAEPKKKKKRRRMREEEEEGQLSGFRFVSPVVNEKTVHGR
ncbi:hypothetical protein PROFUN_11296 [Planoprotostelium fungivorum]|uniref:Uncharacterized protein n=1 Tax=Planoprotostelium fungivorum TaxID=1890364 RepID=A0A2P6N2I3_9EUKA|nr:hypothetical protein PROFUN_11296 [Planoprotostelium fungivorum]